MQLGDARKLTPSAQDAIRCKAMKAVDEGGMSQTMAAEVFEASRSSVYVGQGLPAWWSRGPYKQAHKVAKGWETHIRTDGVHKKVCPGQESRAIALTGLALDP